MSHVLRLQLKISLRVLFNLPVNNTLGMTERRLLIPHASATCTGLRPYFWPITFRVGWSITRIMSQFSWTIRSGGRNRSYFPGDRTGQREFVLLVATHYISSAAEKGGFPFGE